MVKIFSIIFVSSFFWGTANAMIVDPPIYNNPDKVIVVDKFHSQFEIMQNANPTTGYSWTIKDYDKNLLNLVSSHYLTSKSQLAGAGGRMVWIFQATPEAFRQGVDAETKIQLTYARSWSPNDHPTNVEFKVVFNQKSADVHIMNN